MQDFDTGERFHGPDLALRSLNGAYVFYDERPYYICATGGPGRGYIFSLYKIGELNHVVKKIDVQNDPLLDMSSPVLGWVNMEGDCWYISRKALRQWKQGLSEEHCNYWSLTNKLWVRCNRNVFQTQAFADMLLGVYPTYAQVEKRMIESPFFIGQAFSQAFAVSTNKLWYKSQQVGEFDPKTKDWTIIPEFLTPTTRDFLKFQGLTIRN